MKRMMLMLLTGVMVFTIQLSHPKEAEANPRCRRLAKKVRTYKTIRSKYLSAWRRCKWNQGKYSPTCLRLRNKVKAWYGNVRSARANYSAWGCRFGWNKWRDPWALRQARRRAAKKAIRNARIRSRIRYKTAKCQSLASKVTIYKKIRNSYYRSYAKFGCSGWFRRWYRRCRRLKGKVIKYRAKVRAARNHYRAWRCGFSWKRAKKRWHW